MSIEVLLNERHRLMQEVHKIDREIWNVLKSYRTKLSPREYKVLKMRLWERKSLEDVGKELGVTRERIRQIECKAFMKLDYSIEENPRGS